MPEEDYSGTLNSNYSELDLMTPINQVTQISEESVVVNQEAQQPFSQEGQNVNLQNLQYTAKIYTQTQPESSNVFRNNM